MSSGDEGLLFDKGQFGEWAAAVVGAVRRHWLFCLVIVAVFTCAAAAVLRFMPKTFIATTHILAMPSEGAPGTMAAEGTASQSMLADAAANAVFSRDALWALVGRLKLAEDANAADPLVAALQAAASIEVEDGAVDLLVKWPDATQAKQIADALGEDFITARRSAELSPLEDRAASVAAQLQAAQKSVDEALAKFDTEVKSRRSGAKSSTVRGLQAQGLWRATPDPRLVQLRTDILARRKAITELEDVRRRRVAETTAQLNEQKASFGPNHPVLLETREKLASLERGAPQIEAMKREERALLNSFVTLGGKDSDLSAEAAVQPLWPVELADDPRLQYTKANIDLQLQHLQTLRRDDVDAQVTLSAAVAAFPHRYRIVTPASLPTAPVAPVPALIIGIALMCALMTAVLGALLLDFTSGRIHQSFQLRRAGLEVLGVVQASTPRSSLSLVPGPQR